MIRKLVQTRYSRVTLNEKIFRRKYDNNKKISWFKYEYSS
ncbi:hypothetical protein AFI02nite_41780 [Aliivibrio fischeri]|uniref:Uncharacterized protein n=1 Tax=Aliivibrio fischeri TaxID=668 RepID=A0A510UNA3_ALIFS|nr:hypothetical protein AFI02nite_41780 [Aliivibrio fischeri]